LYPSPHIRRVGQDGIMRIKTFRAQSIAEALSAVKKDLGRNAVILHTRTMKQGGLLGFGAKQIFEITASDEPVTAARLARAPKPTIEEVVPGMSSGGAASGRPILAKSAAANAYRRAAELAKAPPAPARAPASPARAPVQPPVAPRQVEEPMLMSVRERRIAEARAGFESQRAASAAQGKLFDASRQAAGPRDPLASARGSQPSPAPAPAPADASPDIHRELADIKLLVNQVLQSGPTTSAGVAAGTMPEALFRHYLLLLESAVSREIADSIIGAVRDELTPGELQDEDIVRTTVLRHIASLIPQAGTPPLRGGRGGYGPHVIALVGPTGVGKTTTVAKLAAAYKLRHGKSVALITSDTYRIAAVDQLRTYAGIIGLPLKVVMNPHEMAAAVQSLSNFDVVLIDTAGRSQFNADRLAELREFIEAANPTEVHLVLSSTAGEAVMQKTVAAFSPLRPGSVILTKLDEAVNFGVIVNVARQLGAAFSFITTGQEVPDDIEAGQPDRLARMVLDNTLVPARAVAPQPFQPQPQPQAYQPAPAPMYYQQPVQPMTAAMPGRDDAAYARMEREGLFGVQPPSAPPGIDTSPYPTYANYTGGHGR
jgi:flagellar biosynthesis protein FlhF